MNLNDVCLNVVVHCTHIPTHAHSHYAASAFNAAITDVIFAFASSMIA
jgi:hypothetical protein